MVDNMMEMLTLDHTHTCTYAMCMFIHFSTAVGTVEPLYRLEDDEESGVCVCVEHALIKLICIFSYYFNFHQEFFFYIIYMILSLKLNQNVMLLS